MCIFKKLAPVSPAAQCEMKMSHEELWDVEKRAQMAALPLEVLLLHQGAAWSPYTTSHSADLSCGHLPHCNPPLCTALTSFCRQMYRSCLWCTCLAPSPTSRTPFHKFTNTPCRSVPSLLLQAFLQHLQEKNWKWNISCKSLWHISRQWSGTKKISFFLIIQPQLMHDPKIKFYLITHNFTVSLPVTTKQIRKLGVIVGQFPHHKGVEKLKQEPLVQSRAASPSPIDKAGQGTAWNRFYEMPCLSDPKCLCTAGKRGCLNSQASPGRGTKLLPYCPGKSLNLWRY